MLLAIPISNHENQKFQVPRMHTKGKPNNKVMGLSRSDFAGLSTSLAHLASQSDESYTSDGSSPDVIPCAIR